MVLLHEKGIASDIISLIKSYLTDRKVKFSTLHSEVNEYITKECPQGSTLGPFLRNVVMDSLLRSQWPENTKAIAYTDDNAISIKDNNRKELANQCMDLLSVRTKRHQLQVLRTKTKFIVFGKISKNRNPTIRYEGIQIARVTEIKYLDIYLDEKLSFLYHVNYITDKARVIF